MANMSMGKLTVVAVLEVEGFDDQTCVVSVPLAVEESSRGATYEVREAFPEVQRQIVLRLNSGNAADREHLANIVSNCLAAGL